MRASTLVCITVAVAMSGFHAGAQTAASPEPRPVPPTGPLLHAAPEFSAWTIARSTVLGLGSQTAEAVARSASVASKPDSLTSVTKTDHIRHQTRKLKTGEQEDIWYEHGNRVTMESIWKIPMFEGATSRANLPQGPDFPELAWIAAGNFVGTQEYQNVAYFVFESQVADGNAAAAKEYGYQLKPTFNRAYVNADTRLPWLLQTGDVLQRYVFQPAPTALLEVPPEYQTMFDTYERKKMEFAKRPVAP